MGAFVWVFLGFSSGVPSPPRKETCLVHSASTEPKPNGKRWHLAKGIACLQDAAGHVKQQPKGGLPTSTLPLTHALGIRFQASRFCKKPPKTEQGKLGHCKASGLCQVSPPCFFSPLIVRTNENPPAICRKASPEATPLRKGNPVNRPEPGTSRLTSRPQWRPVTLLVRAHGGLGRAACGGAKECL